jgi:hypothetical protein
MTPFFDSYSSADSFAQNTACRPPLRGDESFDRNKHAASF